MLSFSIANKKQEDSCGCGVPALKRVGVEARKDLEKFFGKQVHMELYVKVNKNWRSNDRQLKRFGYNQ